MPGTVGATILIFARLPRHYTRLSRRDLVFHTAATEPDAKRVRPGLLHRAGADAELNRPGLEMGFCSNYSKCTIPWRIAQMAASVLSMLLRFVQSFEGGRLKMISAPCPGAVRVFNSPFNSSARSRIPIKHEFGNGLVQRHSFADSHFYPYG